MKTGYCENLDENFAQALNFYENNYTHDELIKFLAEGNIVQRQISALMLDEIKSSCDAKILLSNLTGQDGKIREAVSMRLKEFIADKKYHDCFADINYVEVFLDAIVDINANICRNIIEAVSNLKIYNEFCEKFCTVLTQRTKNLLDVAEKLNFQEGKYKVNKEVFKLYWCLETVYEFSDKMNFNDLKEIILRSKDIGEYTIREKAAKILTNKFDDKELLAAAEQLKKDKNFYVRRYLVND